MFSWVHLRQSVPHCQLLPGKLAVKSEVGGPRESSLLLVNNDGRMIQRCLRP